MADPRWSPLFSHSTGEIDDLPGYTSRTEAVLHGRAISADQPGTEFEMMVRTGDEPWRSASGGLSVAEVQSMRWAA